MINGLLSVYGNNIVLGKMIIDGKEKASAGYNNILLLFTKGKVLMLLRIT